MLTAHVLTHLQTDDWPITAFFSDQYNRKDVMDLELKQTVYWDCLSYYANVIEYNALATSQCKFIDRNNKLHRANYLFSVAISYAKNLQSHYNPNL